MTRMQLAFEKAGIYNTPMSEENKLKEALIETQPEGFELTPGQEQAVEETIEEAKQVEKVLVTAHVPDILYNSKAPSRGWCLTCSCGFRTSTKKYIGEIAKELDEHLAEKKSAKLDLSKEETEARKIQTQISKD